MAWTSTHFRLAIRRALKKKLQDDATLKTLCGDPVQVSYRPAREVGVFNATKKVAITFFDSTNDQDETVPLFDRQVQVDVWSTGGLDLAENVAARIEELLDPGQTGQQGGLALAPEPYTEGLVAHFHGGQAHDAYDYEGDMDQVTLLFNMLVYKYPQGA
jgi:hypothetical protein